MLGSAWVAETEKNFSVLWLACEQQTHFRSSLLFYFSEGEKRRPEMRLLFAGYLMVRSEEGDF